MPSANMQHENVSSEAVLGSERNSFAANLSSFYNRQQHTPSSSSADDDAFFDQAFSKSCDYLIPSENHFNGCAISRSFSEDVLLKPSIKIHVASTKGRLIGWQKVRSGEKIFRSLSSRGQAPRKPSHDSASRTPKRKFTRHQKVIAFCLCLVDFTSFLSMSIIAPFFPGEASAKGMREAVSGFVFSIYALVIVLASPVFGKLLPHVGAKYMFLCGVFFAGVCNILFGLLDYVTETTEFTVLCFVVRTFEALGSAAYSTASCTILINEFPDDIGTVFGLVETCLGVGMSIGPAIGGALYSAGGFGLPFYTLGVFVVLTVPVSWYLLRSVAEPESCASSSVSYKKLLSMPHVIVVCLILWVGSQAQGFIDPTLEPHMRQYDLNAGIIGLLFLLLSGSYALASPFVGWISGKCQNKYPVMVVGLSLVTVSLLLLGPSGILPISGSVWLSIVSLILMGLSFAAAYVPTFESMFIAAMNGGLDDDINTYSIVSGLWNSVYSLGEVTGPSLGGILSDFFTFPEATSLMALCTLIALVVAILAWVNPWYCFGRIGLIDMDTDSEDESLPAMHDDKSYLASSSGITYGSVLASEQAAICIT